MKNLVRHTFLGMGFAASIIFAGGEAAAAPQKLQYNRDIRPILSENCFRCHGPDSASRKAGLRLDREKDATTPRKGGESAIVKGDPVKSLLVARITTTDADDLMPPPDTHKKLTPQQIEMLKRWIKEGAEYQPHWSLIAPQRPALPAVKNKKWARTPIDAFILADLEKAGLKPAPDADRRTLIRRVTLDLTGLPPMPEEVEAFVNDKSPDAYEKVVDRLLNSKSYGEHRARYWLDAARFADTHGIHFDNFRENWAYRDWVIRAFNDNMRFDEFTVEQLAGDLLPNATMEQKIASAFNRCNITTSEGGAIEEEYLVLYARDRTETTSQVWLGMTAGCAVCHDHKFDPISQKDFYSMSAFFNNTTQRAMDGNIKDTPPVIVVPTPDDRKRWEALPGELTTARKLVEDRKAEGRTDFAAWMGATKPETIRAGVPAKGLELQAAFEEGTGSVVTVNFKGQARPFNLSTGIVWEAGHVSAQSYKVQAGGTIELAEAGDFERDKGFSYGAWVKLPEKASGSVISRMDDTNNFRGWDLWVEEGKFGAHLVNKWPEKAVKIIAKTPVQPNTWNHVFITYDGSGKVGGLKLYVNGVLQGVDNQNSEIKETIKTTVPFKVAQRNTTARIDGLSLQDLRLYDRALGPGEVTAIVHGTRNAWLLARSAQLSQPEKDELYNWWLPNVDKTYQQRTGHVAKLQNEENAIKGRGTVAHVMNEKTEAPMAFVLNRGEYDKRKDKVAPATPDALPPMPANLPKNRLGFAKWLLEPEQPLTARVTVNRFWQELFGVGIVRTSGDFGVMGELPSNQALLDWMAVEFRESGWNVKGFFRMLVTSSAYRQSAAVTPEKLRKDPNNRMLSRGPRFRMDAEMVRDYALAASEILSPRVGGPSVKPYQPDGVWEAVAMIGSNTRDYKADKGESLYRRSMYTFWKRSAPPASMDIFNAPSRETCTVRRERTNTPLQALVTLNDPQFVEAARHLAKRALEKESKASDRINFMAERLLARPLRSQELKVVEKTAADFEKFYAANVKEAEALIHVGESKPDDKITPAELAAWTMTANEMMNLDEVLNK